MKKLEVAKVGQISANVSDHSLLRNLRCCIKQQEGGKTNLACRNPGELAECFCYNDCKLTWEATFDNILEMENNRSLQQPLSCKHLKDIAYVISENIVISPDKIEWVKTNEAVHQVLKLIPVMLIKRKKPIYVNFHGFVFTHGALEAFLLSIDPNQDVIIDSEVPRPDQKESDVNQGVGNKHSRQPFTASKFQTLVDSAVEFVKQHSSGAQNCTRTNTGSSAGVSITEIRQHLYDNVPGLKQHGISLSTVRRLFQLPDKGHIASQKYKALIDARIGVKKINYREYHQDSHYLFAQNKQRRKFCTLLSPGDCILSMDDMAKVKVGAPAVSRYHQVKRLFDSTDMPNLNDHDFPVQNYLLSVSGYMYLEQMNDESHRFYLPTYDISEAIEVGSNEVTIDILSDNLWNVLIRTTCQT